MPAGTPCARYVDVQTGILTGEIDMAQTKDGRKYNRIQEYTRQGPNGPIKVSEHVRSNPITSKGKETGKSK